MGCILLIIIYAIPLVSCIIFHIIEKQINKVLPFHKFRTIDIMLRCVIALITIGCFIVIESVFQKKIFSDSLYLIAFMPSFNFIVRKIDEKNNDSSEPEHDLLTSEKYDENDKDFGT